ncbi:hypothetical protein AVEN_81771-1 [Araneus ventricosus]|uniref:Uncharacterized protein n=1 Tax=Araneus ventricosus TaxID=182803 RepID=A0A4Y2UDK9_ARAVE|nr:hypothetical protein AVEN_223489-1 [Araneus ventricosus]GBO11130.1 hypothetical protein AVEN_81771-1 [Araneus ventricosus]
MRSMAPELAPSSPNSRTTRTRGRSNNVRFNVYQAQKHGRSSEESGFESGALRLRNRDLTKRPTRPFTDNNNSKNMFFRLGDV